MVDEDVHDVVDPALDHGPVAAGRLVGPLDGLAVEVGPVHKVLVLGQAHRVGQLALNYLDSVVTWQTHTHT